MRKRTFIAIGKHMVILIIIFIAVVNTNITYPQELNWTPLNGPMGGVVGDIGINSSGDIFAGMYPLLQNGLYKSTDNGDSWEKIRTQFNDFAVYSIFIDREDRIWVGTDQQDRIYLSTDNGDTWQIKNNGYNTYECWAIGESKLGTMFAGRADADLLYRSANLGNDWELAGNIGSLSLAADSNNTVYCGTFNGLYYSTDDGLFWIYNNSLGSFAVSSILIDTNNNIYCGTGYYNNGHGVFYSDDHGQNWTQIGLGGKVVLSLAFDSAGNLYAGTLNDGLYKTSDMGRNWVQYQNGLYRKDVYRLKINQQNDIFIGSEGNGVTGYGDGGVFRSTNGGDHFVQVGLPVSLVRNIAFSGDSVIIAATPSGVQKFNRLTHKWENKGLYRVEAVTISTSNIIYAATQDEGLFKSTDLGENWILTNLTADTLMPVYNVLAINDDTLFASTFYNLRKSTDGGNSWDVLPINTGESAKALFYRDNILWSTGVQSFQSVLYRTTDLGNSFTSLYSGFYTFEINNPISVLKNGYVFISSRNTALAGIARSTDFGLEWEQVVYNENTVPTVFANDSGLIITGTTVFSYNDTNMVYLSTDYGTNWEHFVQPTDFGTAITDIKQDNNGVYFFGTSGEGLFKVDIITDIADETNYKYNFSLSQNYPNPFNPVTTIKYSVPNAGTSHVGTSFMKFVHLKVYNTLGEEVATLVNEEKPAGTYEVKFDGSRLPSGVYIYRLAAGNHMTAKKLVLLK